MKLDSQNQGPPRNADIPGYDPAEHFGAELARAAEGRGIDISPFQEASRQWWREYYARIGWPEGDHAPPPSQKMWTWTGKRGESHERLKWGRYMDPYAAQCQMHTSKIEFANFLVSFIVSILMVGVGGAIGGFFLGGGFVFGTLAILWGVMGYLAFRWSRQRYAWAYWAQMQSLQSGDPVWVPYGWHQLYNLRHHQGRHGLDYTWP